MRHDDGRRHQATPRSPGEQWPRRLVAERDVAIEVMKEIAVVDAERVRSRLLDRNIVGWRLSKTGFAKIAAATVEDVLRCRKVDPAANELTLLDYVRPIECEALSYRVDTLRWPHATRDRRQTTSL